MNRNGNCGGRRQPWGWLALLLMAAAWGRAQTVEFFPSAPTVYEGGTNVSVIVTRTPPVGPATVEFMTQDGTAVMGADYAPTNGTLNFADGESFKLITVLILDDAVPENTKSFNLQLFNPSGAALGLAALTVTIFDDDAVFRFRLATNNVAEDDTNACLEVVRVGGMEISSSVDFYTDSSGTGSVALAIADYIPTSGTLIFDPGVGTNLVKVPIRDDCGVESNETFLVILTNAVAGVISVPDVASVTILDNDTGAGRLEISFIELPGTGIVGTNLSEPNPVNPGAPTTTYSVHVSRLCGSNGAITVEYRLLDFDVIASCLGQRFALRGGGNDVNVGGSGTLTWAAGDDNDKIIPLTIVDDALVELDETLIVELFNVTGGAVINPVRRRQPVRILFDDQPAGAADRTHNVQTALNPSPGANNTVNAIAAYQDGTGRSVVAGDFTAVNAVVRNGIARVDNAGGVDLSFDPGDGADGFVRAVALQADGRILLSGGFQSFNGSSRRGVARLNASGALDTSFDVGAGADGAVHALAVQGDGRVIIAGDFTTYNNIGRVNVARLETNGTLDVTFDPGGGPDGVVYAVAVQADGKIVLGGAFTSVDGIAASHVVRLNADGSVDNDWAPISGADNTVFALALQSDGRALIGGAFNTYDGEARVSVARLTTNGTLDVTFNHCLGMDGAVYAIALQANDQAFIGGDFVAFNGTGRTNYARLRLDGSLDTSFLDSHYNQFQPGANSFVSTIDVQPDGHVMVGGGFSMLGGGFTATNVLTRFNVARVIGNVTVSAGNEPGNIEFVQPAYSVVENVVGSNVTITVRRLNGAVGAVRARYTTVDGSAKAGVDYSAVSNVVTWFDCDATISTFTVPILNNNVAQGNKNFFIELSMPQSLGPLVTNQPALGVQCRAEVTIVEDDFSRGVLGFSQPLFNVVEGQPSATVSVSRTNGASGLVTVQYQTFNGSATAPADYTTRSNTLTFVSGDTNETFTIPIVDDTFQEFDETIGLRLFNVTGGATLGLTNATLLLFDNNNGRGSISFTATDFVVNESAGTAEVTLRRMSGSVGAVTVDFYTLDPPPAPGAARAGVDYLGVTNTVTFASGVTNQTVSVPLLGDRLVEGPETINLFLTNPTGGANLGFLSNAVLTIADDDFYGRLSFSAPAYFANEPAGGVPINVVRSGGDAEEVTVDFSASLGTATDGADYYSTNATLVFPDGVTLQTVVLPIVDDLELELSETVQLSLTNFAKASPGVVTNALLTINDDEALAVPAGSVDTFFNPQPGPNNFVNAIALQADGRLVVGGVFTTFNGNNRRRLVRLNTDGSVDPAFNPGEGANDTVQTVAVQSDGKILAGGRFTQMSGRNRNYIARLTTSGGLDSAFNSGAGADNPVNVIALQPDGRILLGGEFASYNSVPRNRVTRLNADGLIDLSFNPGTGADDSVFALQALPDGKILVSGDFTTMDNQFVSYLARLNADGTLDAGFQVGASINGPVRTFDVQADGRIVIGGLFTAIGGVTRNRLARLNEDGTLDLSFDPGPGANDNVNALAIQTDGKIFVAGNFTGFGGLGRNRIARLTTDGVLDNTINFGSGANQFISTLVLQPDEQILIGGGFTVVNGLPRNYLARLVGGEDSGPGTFQFDLANHEANENGTNVSVVVSRINGATGPADVDVLTLDGSAVGGEDYQSLVTTLTFADGETLKTVTIDLINDTLVETNESFFVVLTNATGGAMLNESAVTTVTILSDDSVVGFSAPNYSVNEKVPGQVQVVEVLRLGATNDTVSVAFATLAGSASPTNDFLPTNGVLTFLPGQTNLSFNVVIVDNTIVEGNETISLQLSNLVGTATFFRPAATITIIDNDSGPGNLTFSQPAYSFLENAGVALITVLRTNGATGPVSLDFSAGGGTAQNGVDYSSSGGTVSLADGETSRNVAIGINDDAVVEGNETFNVTISNPTGGAVLSGPTTVIVTIEDDEVGPGSLDPTFNPGAGANSFVRAVAVTPENQVVVGGAFTTFNNTNRVRVARLDASGTLDTNFSPGLGPNGLVSALGVRPGGRVVIGGAFSSVAGLPFNRLAILDTNGAVDGSFSQPSGLNASVNALVAPPVGNIVVVGGFTLPTPGVARYRDDGSTDTTFDPGSSINGQVQAVFVQDDGRLVIGGSFTLVNGFPRWRVARLETDGFLDPGFNPPAITNGAVFALAVQTDGKVVIGGNFTNVAGVPRNRIARLNADGSLDTLFDPGTGANASVNAIAVQGDGRILIAGDFTSINGTNRGRYARLQNGGALDLVFDPGRGANGVVYALALLPDGKVLIGGDFTQVNGFVRNGVARLNGDLTAPLFMGVGMVDGVPGFNLMVLPGVPYAIEASEDLRTWAPLQTITAPGYYLHFNDTNAAGLGRRFYRARQLSP